MLQRYYLHHLISARLTSLPSLNFSFNNLLNRRHMNRFYSTLLGLLFSVSIAAQAAAPTTTSAVINEGDPAPTLTAICDPIACPSCTFDAGTMNVSVSFTGNHTFVSDLSFYLQAPDGTLVTLIDGVCCPNGGDDFNNLTFTNGTGGGPHVFRCRDTPYRQL